MSSDKSPPAPTEAEERELRELLERILSVATQACLETKRLNRIISSGQQLDARQRMAQMDVAEKQSRVIRQLATMIDANRTPSMTLVQDEPEREDLTQTVFLGQPWWGVTLGGKRIPSRWVARGFAIGLIVFAVLMVLAGMGLDRIGVKPKDVVKTAGRMVAP